MREFESTWDVILQVAIDGGVLCVYSCTLRPLYELYHGTTSDVYMRFSKLVVVVLGCNVGICSLVEHV
jgi:hypothetical protein